MLFLFNLMHFSFYPEVLTHLFSHLVLKDRLLWADILLNIIFIPETSADCYLSTSSPYFLTILFLALPVFHLFAERKSFKYRYPIIYQSKRSLFKGYHIVLVCVRPNTLNNVSLHICVG